MDGCDREKDTRLHSLPAILLSHRSRSKTKQKKRNQFEQYSPRKACSCFICCLGSNQDRQSCEEVQNARYGIREEKRELLEKARCEVTGTPPRPSSSSSKVLFLSFRILKLGFRIEKFYIKTYVSLTCGSQSQRVYPLLRYYMKFFYVI